MVKNELIALAQHLGNKAYAAETDPYAAAVAYQETVQAFLAPLPDDFVPDYEALAAEPVTSQYQDSRESAGVM